MAFSSCICDDFGALDATWNLDNWSRELAIGTLFLGYSDVFVSHERQQFFKSARFCVPVLDLWGIANGTKK
jgi:hypothetical protein